MQAKPRLEWRPQALADLMDIAAYIAEGDPDAAQALKDEIEATRLCDTVTLMGQ